MSHFLMPAMALVLWTFAVSFLMYKRRIPAMNAITKDTQEFIRDPKLMDTLPAPARWAADNYNHLHEQPTLFYAVVLIAFVTEQTGTVNLALAWSYVGVRLAHSLIQVTKNVVLARFSVFFVALLILLVLAARVTWGLLAA